MRDGRRTRLTRFEVVLLMSICATTLLTVTVIYAFAKRDNIFTVTIAEPRGATVLCDFIVDGVTESRKAVVPVTWKFRADDVRFTVITESPTAGDVRVKYWGRQYQSGSTVAPGVQGILQMSPDGDLGLLTPLSARQAQRERELRENTSVDYN